MRKVGLSLLLWPWWWLPMPRSLRRQAPSADDYVCALTGECAEEEAAEPATTTQPEGTPRVSATRGFSLSRPTPADPSKATTTRPGPRARPRRPSGGRRTARS